MSRQPLRTIEEAQELAAAIAAVPGWVVVAVHGWRAGGPPRTSRKHLSTWGGLPGVPAPSYRARLVPPTIAAVTPGGRQVNDGSRVGRPDASEAA